MMVNLRKFQGSSASIPTRDWGVLKVESESFSEASDGDLVVHVGSLPEEGPIPVRIHSECVFSEVFGSTLCDCREQLELALARLVELGGGMLFYLRYDGRGEGLAAKVAATKLELEGLDTWDSRIALGIEPEGRDFSSVAKYLQAHGYSELLLLTDSPEKVSQLETAGIDVEREGLHLEKPSEEVQRLYEAKRKRFGYHL